RSVVAGSIRTLGSVRTGESRSVRMASGRLARVVDRLRINPAGAVGAVLCVCLSLTPSLLPRTWLVQGTVSGVSAVMGYGIGVGTGWAWRRATADRHFGHPRVRRWFPMLVYAATGSLLGLSVYYGSLWQSDLHVLL